jgi:hypothetical protein
LRQHSDPTPPVSRPTRAFPTVWHRYDDFSEGDTNCVDIGLVDSALLPLLTLHRVGGSVPSLADPCGTAHTATRHLTSIDLGILKRKQSTGSCRKRALHHNRLPRATPADSVLISLWPWPPVQPNPARPTIRQTRPTTRHTLPLKHCPTCPTRSKKPPRAMTRLHLPLPRPTRTRMARPPSEQTQKIPRDQRGRRRVERAMHANAPISHVVCKFSIDDLFGPLV